MFEKNMRLDWLLDFYGDALPERTRDMMKQYFEDDLSLSEIADSAHITRQGVRHVIKRGEEELTRLETCLKIAERYRLLGDLSDQIVRICDQLSAASISPDEAADRIRRLAENIKDGL